MEKSEYHDLRVRSLPKMNVGERVLVQDSFGKADGLAKQRWRSARVPKELKLSWTTKCFEEIKFLRSRPQAL